MYNIKNGVSPLVYFDRLYYDMDRLNLVYVYLYNQKEGTYYGTRN